MGYIREDAKKGRVGIQIGGNVLQGVGIGGSPVWIGVLGPIGGNGENCVRDTHRISEINHRELAAVEDERYVVYTKGGGSVGRAMNPVGNNLHWAEIGGGVTVSGAAADI